MTFIRRFLILSHRYLGIVLSVLFVMWFATGIAMLYAREMPRLTPELRLDRLGALDLRAVRLSPAQALERAEWGDGFPDHVSLLTVLDRPAYRLASGNEPLTLFADTGDVLLEVGPERARTVASRFVRQPEPRVQFVGTVTRPDQWTLQQRMPLHKFAVDDGNGTELYVSETTAEVVVMTTSKSRLMAWIGAIPHWMYFTALRTNGAVWRQVMLWTSGLGIVLAALGIALGIVQLRVSRRHRPATLSGILPYSGLMRWHYVTGLVFGIFTLTFVFSGWLSMEPWGWATKAGIRGGGLRQAFTGSPGALSDFPAFDASTWDRLREGAAIKEIEFVRIQDSPVFIMHRQPDGASRTEIRGHQTYFADRSKDPTRLLVDARTLEARHTAFGADALLARVKGALPDTAIVSAELLAEYDSYYYSRDGAAPLPVLRVKLGDEDRTWLYIDPLMSTLVARVHKLDRVERWLYNGLHNLDFAFWYTKRPLWDAGMILLSLGGLAVSGLGLYLGVRRLRRLPKWATRPAAATRRAVPTRA